MPYHGLIFSCNFSNAQRLGGAYRIATFMRNHGWDIEVLDFVMHWSMQEIEEFLASRIGEHTRFVGFSTMWSQWNDHVDGILNLVRRLHPDVITIIGGQQCQMISANPHYFINSYGENALLAILSHHVSAGPHLTLDHDWNQLGKRVLSHSNYPSAPLDSLLISYQDRDFLHEDEWLSIEFGRGCKFKCKFCNYPLLGVTRDHSRSAEDFELQVRDAYDRFGITRYLVSDETFNDDVGKMRKFANVVNGLDFKPYFSGFIRADLMVARPEDRHLLLELGFFGQYYGIESMSKDVGKLMGKGMDPSRLLPGLVEIRSFFKSHGPYRGEISLIVGLPNETKESMAATEQWLCDNWEGEAADAWPLGLPDNPMYNKMNALSLEKESYGYRQSSEPVEDDPYNPNLFNWENDHFTYAEAEKTARLIRGRLNARDFRLSCWSLGDHGAESIEQALRLPKNALTVVPIDRIDRYKRGKLSVC